MSYWVIPAMPNRLRNATSKRILSIITQETETSVADIISKTRKREATQARQMYHYFMRKYTKLSLSRIGSMTGKRDHATVLHSIKTIINLVETDKNIAFMFYSIQSRIESEININQTELKLVQQ